MIATLGDKPASALDQGRPTTGAAAAHPATQRASGAHRITIAILAMGGEGGGVLANWLVDLAEQNGYWAQTTSVPGVAQRTGATVYYLEMFPEALVPPGKLPVMALSPVPGNVDIVIASELLEAGRALQRGLVTAERTTFIASTHRVYTMTERSSMGDGRVNAQALLAGARSAARQFISADFAHLAEQTGSLVGASLYGALAATGRLPFERQAYEATISRAAVGVVSSLKAFAAGHAAATSVMAAPTGSGAPRDMTPGPIAATGPRLTALAARIALQFPAPCHGTLTAGILRTADYQDVAYAASYLDRLEPLAQRLADAGLPAPIAGELLNETARHLALWMTYEDTVRVADLKTRRSRFQRVQGEVRLSGAQLVDIHEFLHPRVEEIADTLPAALGRWLLDTPWARACLAPLTRKGSVVQTSSVRGFMLLYAIAGLRGIRRHSLRFQTEHQRMADWLARITQLAWQPALALEVARAQRLIKGYGDTHARGWRNFQRVMAELPRLQGETDGGLQMQALCKAALADDTEQALARMLEANASRPSPPLTNQASQQPAQTGPRAANTFPTSSATAPN